MTLPTWLSYSLLTLLVSIPFYFFALRNNKKQTQNLERYLRQLMFVPGIVAFGFRAYNGLGFDNIGFGRLSWLILAAVLFPLFMELLLIFLSTRFNLARISPSMIQFREGETHISPSVGLALGNEPQSKSRFSGNLLITILIGAALTLPFSLLEEFGWRGFLQGRVIASFGVGWGLTIGNLVWGFWHAPLVLMGYKFPDYPKLGAFVMMPIATVAFGIVTGYLYVLSGSIWVAAVFNASTRISSKVSQILLGEAGDSRRVRLVWLWLWATVAGLFLAFWVAGGV